jgi:hypothetical protein
VLTENDYTLKMWWVEGNGLVLLAEERVSGVGCRGPPTLLTTPLKGHVLGLKSSPNPLTRQPVNPLGGHLGRFGWVVGGLRI